MSATETAMSSLERNWGMVDKALEDADDAMLGDRPNEESNSMGWLLFHMTRIVDRFVHTWCQEAPQLWAKDGWHQKFGLDDDINTTGQGWTKEQVADWQLPAKDVLLGYYEAVKTAARDYLLPLSVSDTERELDIPPRPPATVGTFLGVMVFDNCVHGGQIAYLRGYYKGMGWFL
ncbi:MAG: DinB family protein [Chloroflexi bacterium]|nr:DinB family protein [Chloroflexota bacterium]